MLTKIISWIKANKVVSVIIVVLLFLLLKGNINTLNGGVYRMSSFDSVSSIAPEIGFEKATPSYNLGIEERKVVTNSNFSLLVKKVNETVDGIRSKATEYKGYVTNVSISRDEEADQATIEIRVPSDKLEDFSKYLRSIAVKVVYENISGYDITDKYTDYAKRLESLESTKTKLEAILNRAGTADEILNVQNRIFEIQNQIDSIKGQMMYMDKASSTSKISIVISTDELSLPYTPVKSWRPGVVFKQAVRALLGVLITTGEFGIWIIVFSPLILIAFVLKKLIFKRRI